MAFRYLLSLEHGSILIGLACSLAYSAHNLQSVELCHIQLAQALVQNNQEEQAFEQYQHALALNPHNTTALLQCGLHLFKKGDYEHAQSHLAKRYALVPNCPQTVFCLAECHACMNDWATALPLYHQAAQLNQSSVPILTRLAEAYHKNNDILKAIKYLKKAYRLEPNSWHMLIRLAILYREAHNYQESLSAIDTVLHSQPDNVRALLEKATTLVYMQEYRQARELYIRLAELDPHNLYMHYNIGFTLKKEGLLHEAESVYRAILAIDPNHAQTQLGLSQVLLSLGNYEEGFKAFEWRSSYVRAKNKKRLEHLDTLNGKRVALRSEWGTAEVIHCLRYAALLKEYGAITIAYVPPALSAVCATCPYIDYVVPDSEPLSEYDFYIHCMSLPYVCATTLKNIPIPIPYLIIDQPSKRLWLTELKHDNHVKVGLYWGSPGPHTPAAEERALSLSSLTALTRFQGLSFYALQESACHSWASGKVLHMPHGINETRPDYLIKLAALIDSLDLIITVDGLIAHLAGALGKPTLLVLPIHCDWRWLTTGPSSPWYPTVRIFRQTCPGSWHEPIEELIHYLQTLYPLSSQE